MKISILLLASLIHLQAYAAELILFEIVAGSHSPQGIKLEIQNIGGTKVYVASKSAGGRVVGQVAIPDTSYRQIIRDFEKALPKSTRRKTPPLLACGQPFTIHTKVSERVFDIENYCADYADRITKDLFAKWWRDSNRILGF